MTKAKLEELLERVEEAEGPDRELDFELALLHKVAPPDSWYDKVNDCIEWRELVDYGSTQVPMPVGSELFNYTASLDAAIALVGEVLPGWYIHLDTSGGGEGDASREYGAHIVQNVFDKMPISGLTLGHPSFALALIAALLKAKIAELEE